MLGFLQSIMERFLEQISNVYSKLIYPSQFIPHVFNDTNRKQILQCAQHISEIVRSSDRYSVVSKDSIPQHCRQYGMVQPWTGMKGADSTTLRYATVSGA